MEVLLAYECDKFNEGQSLRVEESLRHVAIVFLKEFNSFVGEAPAQQNFRMKPLVLVAVSLTVVDSVKPR